MVWAAASFRALDASPSCVEVRGVCRFCGRTEPLEGLLHPSAQVAASVVTGLDCLDSLLTSHAASDQRLLLPVALDVESSAEGYQLTSCPSHLESLEKGLRRLVRLRPMVHHARFTATSRPLG